jgi:beta-glucanase (GH16 family)
MVLTFHDEFDEDSISREGTGEASCWTDHLWYEQPMPPGRHSVSGGVLHLYAGDGLGIATVNSSGEGFTQRFGYFEARIKLPGGKGTWPAFWAISRAHAFEGGAASELDIMEGQGIRSTGYFATLHRDSGSGHDRQNSGNFIKTGTDLSKDFHRYGALWPPDSDLIVFYFDGKPVGSALKYDTTDQAPMMVILGNVYGDMIGSNQPDETTPHPADMQVDYVRIYQFEDRLPAAGRAASTRP